MPDFSAESAYVFRHALLREAAYELQMPAERAQLHQLAAALIEDLYAADPALLAGIAAEIADHLRAASGQQPDPALLESERRFTLLGAKHAEANWDHDAVRRLYGRLADIGNAGEQALALQVLYASCKWSHRDGETSRTIARRLLRLGRAVDDPHLVAKALTLLALESADSRREKLERMAFRTAWQGGSWKVAGLALGNMAQQAWRAGDHRRASALLRRAIALSRRGNNSTGEGHFLGSLARVLLAQGRHTEALQAAREAIRILQQSNSPGWLANNLRTLATICAGQRLWDEAEQALRQLADAFERMHQHAEGAHVLFERALLRLEQDNDTAARELWTQGLAVVRRHGPSTNNAEPEERMRRRCAELVIATLDTD